MSMDIYAECGTKVKFTGKGGYDMQIHNAKQILTLGKVYTVESIEVHSWISFVTLEEFPNHEFNTCLFEDVEVNAAEA